jgi:hypothetical protein
MNEDDGESDNETVSVFRKKLIFILLISAANQAKLDQVQMHQSVK